MKRRLAAGCAAAVLLSAGCSAGTRPAAGPAVAGPSTARLLSAAALEPCPRAAASPTSAPAGTALPAVALRCLGDGPPTRLADLRGPAILNLWASWCLPCQRELPALQALHAEAGDRLLVLGVVTDDTSRNALGFAAAAGVHYPSLVDTNGTVRRRLGYPGPPVTLFLDRSGRIVHRLVGAAPALPALKALLARQLGVAL